MIDENIVFIIIVIIITIIFLFILLRIWEIVKPYLKIAQKIIKVTDIIKDFNTDIALTLLNLIKDVITGLFKIFNFEETVIIAINPAVIKIDELLDEKTLIDLIARSKRIVVTAIGQSSKNAVRFANQLAKNLAPVSLVLFDPDVESDSQIDDKIHTINIISRELNVTARSADDILDFNVSRSRNSKLEYNIIKPSSDSINDYMEAVKNGFF